MRLDAPVGLPLPPLPGIAAAHLTDIAAQLLARRLAAEQLLRLLQEQHPVQLHVGSLVCQGRPDQVLGTWVLAPGPLGQLGRDPHPDPSIAEKSVAPWTPGGRSTYSGVIRR